MTATTNQLTNLSLYNIPTSSPCAGQRGGDGPEGECGGANAHPLCVPAAHAAPVFEYGVIISKDDIFTGEHLFSHFEDVMFSSLEKAVLHAVSMEGMTDRKRNRSTVRAIFKMNRLTGEIEPLYDRMGALHLIEKAEIEAQDAERDLDPNAEHKADYHAQCI